MAGAVFALSLFGLGAVQALPSATTLEARQIFIGDGTGVFVPFPDETLPPCLVSGSEAPQAPCLLPPIPGGIELPPGLGFWPKDKRDAVDKRQFWIGDGTVGIWPGNGAPKKPCLVGIPLKSQPPCIISPGKEKRGLETRQTFIIGGGGTLPPGLIGGGGIPVCLTGVALSQQPPCFLPPISGGGLILPPKEKREAGEPRFVLPPDAASNPKKYIEKLELDLEALQNKKHKSRHDLQKIKDIKAALLYLVGITDIQAPPGTGSTFTPGKRQFSLPPDAPSNPKKYIEKLELELEALQNKRYKTRSDVQKIKDIKAALLYLVGITNISAPPGTGSTFTPGKRDPAFSLPPDAATNPKRVLEELEGRLIALQNKRHKTDEDREDIELIKAAILYVAGITNISAPPGTGSTFTPGKRDPAFKLPPDAATNPKRVLEELQRRLIALQNKRNKTDEDREDIELIKAALLYVAGISNISAPPGTGSTFTPGKRDPAFKLPPDAATNPKRVLEELQRRLIALQNKRNKTDEDREDIELIKAALLYVAGISNISAPPGTGSTFTPGKRDAVLTPEFDLQGLINSYNNLVLTIQGSSGETSSTTYLVLSQIADALALYGYKVDRIAPTLVPLHPKRQVNIITIGGTTCRGNDISGLKSALEALLKAYGDPSKAPRTIWFIQQVLVTALQICGQGVEGWTTIIPGKPIPGGPIVPDPYVPGGPIKPDPYVPGGPIKPDPYVPGNPIKPSD